jgi:hypothetical protein
LIDVLSSTRWRLFMVYGKMPSLAIFRCGDGYAASLIGLTLASTTRAVRQLATLRGIAHEERGGCSEWVPSSVCFRAATREALSGLANEARIAVTSVSMAGVDELARNGRARATSPPPVNYAERSPAGWMTALGTPAGIDAFHWFRRDSPDYWEVISDKARYWAYDPNSARLWASRIAGLPPITPAGEVILAQRAFVPLALARFLSTVTGLRSGPFAQQAWKHCYPVHSTSISTWLVRRLDELLQTG